MTLSLDDLWGGTLLDTRIDVTEREATFLVKVVNGGLVARLKLTLHGVAQLVITRPDGAQWEYTEITEVHAAEIDSHVRIDLTFWHEPHGLSATCASWTLASGA